MKTKLKRVLVIIMLAFIIIAQTGLVNAATYIVGIKALRDDPDRVQKPIDQAQYQGDSIPYAYRFGVPGVGGMPARTMLWKLIDYTSGTANWNTAIYCLDQGKGFMTETGTLAALEAERIEYNLSEPMKIKQASLPTASFEKSSPLEGSALLKAIADSNTNNRVLWILDHCFLPKSDDRAALRNQLLTDVLKFYSENNNYATLCGLADEFDSYTVGSFKLTDSDIEVVQQAAIWYFTNFSDNSDWQALPTIFLDTVGDPSVSGSFSLDLSTINLGTNREGQRRNFEAGLLYKYFIIEAKKDSTLYNTTRDKVPTITMSQTNPKVAGNDAGGVNVGPFKYTVAENSKAVYGYSLEVKVKTAANPTYTAITNYTIKKSDGTVVTDISTIKDTNFYIEVADETITGMEVTVKAKYDKKEVTYWTVEGSEDTEQPLAIITNESPEISDKITANSEPKQFDLALRKYITKVNGLTPPNERKLDNIDTSTIESSTTTATYNHRKDPVVVKTGDIVTYKIIIYNEGDIDGYAKEIIDRLPTGLKFKEVLTQDYDYEYDETTNMVKLIRKSTAVIKAYDGVTLSKEEIEIECEVVGTKGTEDKILTNIAWIEKDSEGTDRDSTPAEHPNVPEEDLPDYRGSTPAGEPLDQDDYYYPGQEDDDDFEKLIIPGAEFDLALRKFITKVNDKTLTGEDDRNPNPDTTNLDKIVDGKKQTTADYEAHKDPILVKPGDIVTYTIRIYNEGEVSGYAQEIADYIPEGLGYLVEHNTNIANKWKLAEGATSEKIGKVTKTLDNVKLSDYTGVTDVTNIDVVCGKAKITTDKLKYVEGSKDNLIESYNKESGDLSFKDVQITCVVLDKATKTTLKNIAEITEDADENGKPIKDRDSDPNSVNPDNYPNGKNIQDDDDYEDLTLEDKIFDLSLRKFITAVRDLDVEQEITTRIPKVSYKDGVFTYDHTKEPVVVANTNIVTYTIRVYNEGEVDGYAKEVKDDIPEGLIYLPDNAINKKYGWKVSEDGKTIRTDYLSKEQSEIRKEDNLIKAFDKTKAVSDTNPDYRDVKVAFRVDSSKIGPDRIVTNTAEISKHSDKDGNDVKDKDSTPDNNKPGEDDIDTEKIRVKKFDLSLLKYVSKVITIENGEQTVRETGYNGLEDPKPIVKVDLHRKKIKDVTVKFGYTIKVTNEGEIAGYAKEIKDYIPEGLKFLAEDNPDWKVVEDQKVYSTDKLKDTLLKPGESGTVEIILTWINNEDNMGQKTNTAEISKDYNDYNEPDIDSTPDNKKEGEDDIDYAHVILSISTGGEPVYFILSATILVIIAGGLFLIKRYVL